MNLIKQPDHSHPWISIIGKMVTKESTGDNQECLGHFLNLGLPTSKDERWRAGNPTKFLSGYSPLPLTSQLSVETLVADITNISPYYLILQDGQILAQAPQLKDILKIGSSSDSADHADNQQALDWLNQALAPAQISITLETKQKLAFPLVIYHHASIQNESNQSLPGSTYSRLHFEALADSSMHVLEVFSSEMEIAYQRNARTFFNLHNNSHVTYTRVQNDSLQACHYGKVIAKVSAHAFFKSFSYNFGAALSRLELDLSMRQEGAQVWAHGLFPIAGDQQSDTFSEIFHLAPHTTSHQLFKGMATDKSHGIFTGNISIAPKAQKVEASQLSQNLLLSKLAHIDTRPRLMVAADDVKCGHGATIGQLGEEELFYLESRGLSKERALQLLQSAFCQQVIDQMEDKNIMQYLLQLLAKKTLEFKSSGVKHD